MNSTLISNQGWCGAEGNSVDVGDEICRRPGVEAAEYGFPQRGRTVEAEMRMLRRKGDHTHTHKKKIDIDFRK